MEKKYIIGAADLWSYMSQFSPYVHTIIIQGLNHHLCTREDISLHVLDLCSSTHACRFKPKRVSLKSWYSKTCLSKPAVMHPIQ